ncbi:serine protease inhibitor 28Dc [Sitodiplosis mosellana]|uniref:serine protease inhibitor 28Dc n=1 Tax=Sitodiplosis mosellana TaxID=263140 RepID=UPI0024446F4B|nr:serine protease inhibitor 28Dc [Sitodiplosis mosellana]XP_055295013.1 serine protease inhibitor 28Dc [Sitodiplosis mosellana]
MGVLKVAGVSYLLLAAILLVCAQNGNNQSSEDDPRFDARVSELLAKNMLQLSQEIGTTILQDSDRPTEVFSPLSIYTALSILLMGANGQTFQELMGLLKINSDSYLSQNTWKVHEELSLMIDDLNGTIPHPGHRRRYQALWRNQNALHENRNQNQESLQQISVANGIFFQNGYSIRDDFRDAMQSAYQAHLQRLDFANKPDLSTKYINSWVNEKTQGKIKKILTNELPQSTKAIIASALYFKALWERTFYEAGTKPREFYPDGINRPPIMVDMMAIGGSYPFYDSKEYDCRIIALPYRKHLTTMYIIIPNKSTRHRLRQFQATLTADKIQEMISKMEWKTAIILFPKLHITNRIDLKMVLKRMGLRSLFSYDQSDLSLISTGVETPLSQNHFPGTLNNVDDRQFLFPRFDDVESRNATASTRNATHEAAKNNTNDAAKRERRSAVTYKATSSDTNAQREPLRLKDLVISKRITKSYPYIKLRSRLRRDIPTDPSLNLKRLDLLRTRLSSERYPNPGLFADELIHQIDLTVNEVGTEGGAATITTLNRSGPDILFRAETPFLFLIRHEDTKIPIFYGTVFEPTNF